MPEPRPTGITPVPEAPWGEHMSVFFDTAEDLFDVVSNFFNAGLSGNEKCLWVTSDPFTVEQALAGLAETIPDLDRRVREGAVELAAGAEWYLTNDELDAERVVGAWLKCADDALEQGFAGIRVIGSAFWLQSKYWDSFAEYERHLSAQICGRKLLVLCVYPLREASACDVLDVTKAHDFSIARRNGRWEFLESPEQAIARREIGRLEQALDILSLPFPGREKLTPRERITLAQIVRGASNKEAARALMISPRTVEFHRANIMRKLGARNIAELMSVVFGAAGTGVEAGPKTKRT